MASDTNEVSAGQLLAKMGTDAQKWTEQFLHASGLDNAGPDFRGTVLAWFSNALAAGHSAGWSAGWTSQATGNPGINDIASRSNETAHAHGWWDEPRSFGEVVALIHSEASEALEEWRDNHSPEERYYSVAKFRPEPHQITEGDAEMLPDVQDWARLLDRRGDGGYVDPTELPDIIALTLVRAGFLKPEGVPSELADIVIRVGDASEEYSIDLAHEIALKQSYNNTRPYKHGGKRS